MARGGVGVLVGSTVAATGGVGERVEVAVGAGVLVGIEVAVGTEVSVGVGVAVAVGKGVAVGVPVGAEVGVLVGTKVLVGVGQVAVGPSGADVVAAATAVGADVGALLGDIASQATTIAVIAAAAITNSRSAIQVLPLQPCFCPRRHCSIQCRGLFSFILILSPSRTIREQRHGAFYPLQTGATKSLHLLIPHDHTPQTTLPQNANKCKFWPGPIVL